MNVLRFLSSIYRRDPRNEQDNCCPAESVACDPPVFPAQQTSFEATYGSQPTITLVILGTLPMLWEVTAGSLPPGLFLDPSASLISGVVTTPGEYSWTVTVTNNCGSASIPLTMTVT